MIVVSDTSCLCYLALIGREAILSGLYGQVVIPPAVAQELNRGAVNHAEIQRVLQESWLTVHTLNQMGRAADFAAFVDEAEAEALVLYEELNADLLLVDDLAARELAEKLGIKKVGLLGVLLEAHRAGLLDDSLETVLDDLLKLGFRAGTPLIESILKEAGDTPTTT